MNVMLVARTAAISLVVVCAWSSVHAQSPADARSLAASCTFCHGTDGRSAGVNPGLAGVDKDYIAQQMKAYKAGKLPGTIMHQLAKGYTDAQIDSIAAYFAAQKR